MCSSDLRTPGNKRGSMQTRIRNLRTETVIDNRARAQVSHARLHGAALVAGCAVIHAKDGEKLALVLDDHAGAELCRFDAAHCFFAAAKRPAAP